MSARGKALDRQANTKFRSSLKCYICITSLFTASTSLALGIFHIHLQSHQDPLISWTFIGRCNKKEPSLGDNPCMACAKVQGTLAACLEVRMRQAAYIR